MRRLTLRRIDWPAVIRDIAKAGVTMDQVARAVGRARSWVSMLKAGMANDPRHRDGEALLILWTQATGRVASEAPRHDPRAVRILDSRGSSIGATPIR